MAINQNHTFEELEGVKCAIVEKNASPERVDFLRTILEYNRYTVVVVATAPQKPVATAKTLSGTIETAVEKVPEAAPAATFTIGVTDVVFNVTNAIFGRLLKLPDDIVVTLAYWQQKDGKSRDDIPYFN